MYNTYQNTRLTPPTHIKLLQKSLIATAVSMVICGRAFAAADITIKVADASHLSVTTNAKEITISIADTAVVDMVGLLAAKPVTKREVGKISHIVAIDANESAAVSYGNSGKTVSIKIAKADAATATANPEAAKAEPAAAKEKASNTSVPKNEWAVPSSPAFELIGASPNLANLPKAPRDLAAHIVAGRSSDGTFQKGIAIDASLYQMLKALPFITQGYLDELTKKTAAKPNLAQKGISAVLPGINDDDHVVESRFVNRLKLSFATTQEENKATAPIKLGFGLHYTLWDYADKLTACPDAKILRERAEKFADILPAQSDKLCSEAQKSTDSNTEKVFFARPAAAVGYGRSYSLPDGKWDARIASTRGLWFTAATGGVALAKSDRDSEAARVQLVFHHRWYKDQPTAAVAAVPAVAATASTPAIAAIAAIPASKEDLRLWAARLKLGQPKGGFSYEYSRGKRKPMLGKHDKTTRQAYGFEWKVGKDTWLVASAGKETSAITGIKNQPFIVTTLRFGGESGE
jgi:hypothetical protein